MRTLYEAANSLEAHMLKDLLAQEGLNAHVQGEHLQGGVGELPAAGLVRLMIDEADHAAGRTLIARWEAQQPAPSPAPAEPGRRSRVVAFIWGAVLAGAACWGFVSTPISRDGTDYNYDGKLDSSWIYSPRGMPLRNEVDRNLDGRLDQISYFDSRGLLERTESDDDFDGRFESLTRYENDNPLTTDTDTDGDSYIDLRTRFRHGVISSVEFIDPVSARPVRIEYLRLGKLERAEVDSDGDGTFDRHIAYSPLGEAVEPAAH
jgi:Putative prokaryotic signal transducing protein